MSAQVRKFKFRYDPAKALATRELDRQRIADEMRAAALDARTRRSIAWRLVEIRAELRHAGTRPTRAQALAALEAMGHKLIACAGEACQRAGHTYVKYARAHR